MFGYWFHLKVKFWLLALRIAAWLLAAIERKAEKSIGLVESGIFVTNEQGNILAGVIRVSKDEELTVFGPN